MNEITTTQEDLLRTLFKFEAENERLHDVIDKIRAELHYNAELHEDGSYYLLEEWVDEIFDKYKSESEDPI